MSTAPAFIATEVWEAKRDEISKLYSVDEWPLKQVIKKVRSASFSPTEAQLRGKLKKWKVIKPNRRCRKKQLVTSDEVDDESQEVIDVPELPEVPEAPTEQNEVPPPITTTQENIVGESSCSNQQTTVTNWSADTSQLPSATPDYLWNLPMQMIDSPYPLPHGLPSTMPAQTEVPNARHPLQIPPTNSLNCPNLGSMYPLSPTPSPHWPTSVDTSPGVVDGPNMPTPPVAWMPSQHTSDSFYMHQPPLPYRPPITQPVYSPPMDMHNEPSRHPHPPPTPTSYFRNAMDPSYVTQPQCMNVPNKASLNPHPTPTSMSCPPSTIAPLFLSQPQQMNVLNRPLWKPYPTPTSYPHSTMDAPYASQSVYNQSPHSSNESPFSQQASTDIMTPNQYHPHHDTPLYFHPSQTTPQQCWTQHPPNSENMREVWAQMPWRSSNDAASGHPRTTRVRKAVRIRHVDSDDEKKASRKTEPQGPRLVGQTGF